jgi:hypothetical protein
MRLVAVAVAAAALAVLPSPTRSQDGTVRGGPTPAPKADAGPAAPPRAEAAPKAGGSSQGGTAAKPPAAALDLARALLTSVQWGKVLDSYASSLAGQVSQALLAKGEKVPDDLRGKLRSELERTLPYQQTVQAQAEALSKELSADELRRTASFYGSPLGRKVLDKLPEAQSAVAQQLQARLATAVPEILARLAPSAMSGGPGGDGSRERSGTGSSGGPAPVEGQRPPAQGSTTR